MPIQKFHCIAHSGNFEHITIRQTHPGPPLTPPFGELLHITQLLPVTDGILSQVCFFVPLRNPVQIIPVDATLSNKQTAPLL